MNIISVLPHIQAILNLTAMSLITMGYYFIRQPNKSAHQTSMILALVVSTIFLVAYLYYHSQVGNVQFAGQGLIRPIYFSILISHILLAALVAPLILVTITFVLRKKFDQHRRLGRVLLPLWLYVSASGVVVYILAFHVYSL